MQIVLRYLPQALIIIAFLVVIILIVRKLPKTAKVEVDLASDKSAKAAAKAKSKLPSIISKTGAIFATAGRGIAVGSKKTARVIFRGRMAGVLKNAVKRRKKKNVPETKSVMSKAGTGTALSEKEQTVVKLLKEAEDYSRQANWSAAEKVFIKVVALEPKTLEAYLGLGNLYMKQKNWDDAVEAYRIAVEGDDTNVNAHGNLGTALANKGEWVAAVESLQKATKLDPGNAVRQATLGMAFMTIKDYKKAVKAYKEAVDHDRENMSHRVELAKAAKMTDDKAVAEEMLSAVLARDPLNEEAKKLMEEVRSKKELE